MIKRTFAAALLLAGMLLVLVVPAAMAQGQGDDKIVFGDSVTIGQGETVDGNLIVFGGDVTLEEGGRVTEGVVIFGGNVTINGRVGGDVAMFGGNGHLGESAEVDGRLVTVGGSVTRDPGAEVRGGEGSGFEPPVTRPPRPVETAVELILRAARGVLTSVALAALALLVMLFWPLPVSRVAETAGRAPALSGGMGLFTSVAAGLLFTALALTICLSPISALGFVVLAAAALFGWVALGLLIGNRLLGSRATSPAVSAGVGTLLLSLASSLFGLIACVGPLIPVLLGCLGLGAVVLTRFGTRPYLPAGGSPVSTEIPPPPVEPMS